MQDDKKQPSIKESSSQKGTTGVEEEKGGFENRSNQGGLMADSSTQEINSSKEAGSNVQINTRLQSVVEGGLNQNSTPAVGNNTPKKRFPKMFVFFVLFFLTLGVLVYLFLKFRETGSFIPSGTKGEIVWWGIQHDILVYRPLIEKFEKENPNIKIRYERQSTRDYRVRLQNALVSGKGPDVFEMHNTWVPMFRNELSTLPESVMSIDEFNKSFYPIIVSNLTLDKGVVGMPLEYDALTLFINEDVFTSALKSPPNTWSDVQDLAPQLTQTGKKGVIIQSGVALGITENIDHWPEIVALMLYQNGVNPARPVGVSAVQVFSVYKLFSGAKVWNNTLPDSTVAFSRGELAMYFGPTSRASEIVRANPNLKFRTVKLPQLPKNKPEDPNVSYATYWVQGVSERSKAKEGAWIFMKFLSREDSLKEINENIINNQTFGKVYPRPEMNVDMIQDSILGSIIAFANDAKSFYLADNTHDGSDGINTLVNGLFESVINSSASDKILQDKSQELSRILGRFNIRVR